MTRRLDKTELARKDLIDMIRTRKRLEHRIAMRHELNELEAALLDELDARIAGGIPYELTCDDVYNIVERSK